ncbi:MAG: NADH-quinone oxidoreductase subunit M [Nitrospirales bacterium]|nr:NADH-quinone oxidoreductase subunit M [Nitrospirales bacterium]
MNVIFTEHLLSVMIAIPFLGIAIIACVQDQEWIRRVALGSTMGDAVLSLVLLKEFDFSMQGMQFVERLAWMPTFNIQYAVGVDGISLLLVLLTTLLCPFCVLCSWNAITTRVRSFMAMILLVEGAMIVVFTALDLFLFFMLWEVTMIPMYFMIILWGGPQRIAAGIKFVLYSLSGSLILLLAILGLYVEGGRTFDILVLAEQTYSPDAQFWIFLAFFLAFAIKLPMLPFHTWLPDAHSEAPTAGSVILAGVLLKMGGYGFLRFCLPMFPEASVTFAPFILWLSVAGILYGGYMALAQSDLKKLVAYSSISHMGFVTLGIFVFNNHGIQGAILQMVNHGLRPALSFWPLVNCMTGPIAGRFKITVAYRNPCPGLWRSFVSFPWPHLDCRERATLLENFWFWSEHPLKVILWFCCPWEELFWLQRICSGCCNESFWVNPKAPPFPN